MHKQSDQRKRNRKRYPSTRQQKLQPAPDIIAWLSPGTPGWQTPQLPSATERDDKRQLALLSPEVV
jgi:hypothetical protein